MQSIDYTLPLNCSNIHLPFRRACKELDLTYQELADGSGVPLPNISKFMRGVVKNPNIDYLAALAKFLNAKAGRIVISLDEICGIKEAEPPCSEIEEENKALKHKIELLESDNQHKAEMLNKEITAKNYIKRTCRILSIALAFIVIVLVSLLILDRVNGDWGYWRYEASQWNDAGGILNYILTSVGNGIKFAFCLR